MTPHRNLFSQHPLAQLAVALSAGICAASYLPARFMFAAIACAVCSILASVLVFRRRVSLAGIMLLLAFFFAGETLAMIELRAGTSRAITDFVDKPVTLTGVLDGPPEYARDRVHLSLRVEAIKLNDSETIMPGRVSLLAPFRNAATEQDYRSLQLRYGTRVRVATTIDNTGDYRNPGVSTLAEYLDRRGCDATGIVKSPASLARLDDTTVFRPLAWLYDRRELLQREIDARFTPETAGVLDAALLGNRYNLSRAASERFREGGTFHVLVISGLHISFIGGIVFLGVRRLTKRRLTQFMVPAMVVWAYSLAVGAEASVIRAALMFTFAGLAAVLFRQATSLNALGGAALVLLVQSPKELFDPSFQLTFLSVLAIVAIAWPLLLRLSAIGSWYPTRSSPYPPACSPALKSLCETLFWSEQQWQTELEHTPHHYRLFKTWLAVWLERHHLQRLLRYLFGAFVVSASVQVVLLPLMIVYFHRVSLASLVLNVVVSVVLAALVTVAMFALLIAQVSVTMATPLFKLADALDWVMVHSVDPFSHLGIAALRLPEYSGKPALVYAVYYLPLLLLVLALSRWHPLAAPSEMPSRLHRCVVLSALAHALLSAALLLHPFSNGRADGNLRVDFLDVGQGDSALVTMPDGTTLLIDGGGRPAFPTTANANEEARRIGETVVSEYLWWRGLSEIDYVLATHADADHIDGLNDVLKNFAVRAALVARRPGADPEFSKFSQTIAQTRTHLETIQAGDVIDFGAVHVSVLWPPAGGDTSSNNDSVVLRIQFGGRSILFTGDIERAAESALLESGPQLRADVVKVPHHGSKSSSTEPFVLATKPHFAIISVGRTSMFGHPHQEVVDRWRANGATVLTTGHSGTITLTTDGHNLTLKEFIEPQRGTKDTKE
jgi:competence protein ComEC